MNRLLVAMLVLGSVPAFAGDFDSDVKPICHIQFGASSMTDTPNDKMYYSEDNTGPFRLIESIKSTTWINPSVLLNTGVEAPAKETLGMCLETAANNVILDRYSQDLDKSQNTAIVAYKDQKYLLIKIK